MHNYDDHQGHQCIALCPPLPTVWEVSQCSMTTELARDWPILFIFMHYAIVQYS